MIRLFIALEFPAPVRERLRGLGGGVPGARWEPIENFHLTLRFLGETDNSRLDDLDANLDRIDTPGFDLVLDGVGQFGAGNRARALWAGVAACDALTHLQDKVESAVVRAGFLPESRKFIPHITLARLKATPADRLQRFLTERAAFRTPPIPITHFSLFESHPGRNGSIYQVLKEYALGRPTA